MEIREPFCVCGHLETEHGGKSQLCYGSIGAETTLCTCHGYREGRRSRELAEQ